MKTLEVSFWYTTRRQFPPCWIYTSVTNLAPCIINRINIVQDIIMILAKFSDNKVSVMSDLETLTKHGFSVKFFKISYDLFVHWCIGGRYYLTWIKLNSSTKSFFKPGEWTGALSNTRTHLNGKFLLCRYFLTTEQKLINTFYKNVSGHPNFLLLRHITGNLLFKTLFRLKTFGLSEWYTNINLTLKSSLALPYSKRVVSLSFIGLCSGNVFPH